jgi:uncharacterized membrane protein YvlD (DUF360 family)
MPKKIFLLFLLLAFPSISFAQYDCSAPIVPCRLGECTFCDLFKLLNNIINYLLWCLVPPLAILMIVIAGFLYVGVILEFLPGGMETISQAKRIFTSVVIGVILAYAAWALISLFLMALGYKDWRNWYQINC